MVYPYSEVLRRGRELVWDTVFGGREEEDGTWVWKTEEGVFSVKQIKTQAKQSSS